MLPEEVEYIVWHCSATKKGTRYRFNQCKADHIIHRGFSDIGYHVYVEIDGRVRFGRPMTKPGAHALNYNNRSISVCYEGGLDENGSPCDTRTEKQKQSMISTYLFLSAVFAKAKHVGHRDLSPDLNGNGIIEKHEWMKSCPCFEVKNEYK